MIKFRFYVIFEISPFLISIRKKLFANEQERIETLPFLSIQQKVFAKRARKENNQQRQGICVIHTYNDNNRESINDMNMTRHRSDRVGGIDEVACDWYTFNATYLHDELDAYLTLILSLDDNFQFVVVLYHYYSVMMTMTMH